MVGILPDVANGALVTRDGAGVPTNPPGVQGSYVPPAGFTSSCLLTALPSDCTARMSAAQINAIVSELLCFMATLNPDGTYNCASLCNISAAFNAWWDEHNNTNATIDGDGTAGNLFRVNPLATVAAILANDAAGDGLAVGLTSTALTNILTTGPDGRLFVPAPAAAPAPVIRNYLTGLELSTAGASASFGITAGIAADRTNVEMMELTAALTKTTAAWAPGNAGALDTGAIVANTWYNVHEIKRPDLGTVDVCISLSSVAPTVGGANPIPAAYTRNRCIGSMKTNASSQWVKFVQVGDDFDWDAVSGPNVTFAGTTAVQAGVVNVPPKARVIAKLHVLAIAPGAGAGQGRAWIFPPDTNTALAIASAANFNAGIFTSAAGSQGAQRMDVRTNAAGNITCSLEVTTMTVQVTASGWIDRRGRDG